MGRVLLAGASGLVGRALVEVLLDRSGALVPPCVVLARRQLSEFAQREGLRVEVRENLLEPQPLPPVDTVLVALGTTQKVAGSLAGLAEVDRDMVVRIAEACLEQGARRIGVVSSKGADPKAIIGYSRVKGEMEAAVEALGYETTVFAQPALLAGSRAGLGQPKRRGEAWANHLLNPIGRWLPRAVRPIAPLDVAVALVDALCCATPGVRRLSSSSMQTVAESL